MNVQRVTVIGAGTMGAGIAQAFASAGFATTLNDVDAAAIQRGLDRIRAPLQKRVGEGKMKASDLDGLLAKLRPEADFAAAVRDADLIVEAVFEDLQVKTDLFRNLDASAKPNAILATNTSSLYVHDLAAATRHPERVVGLHFFFPAAVNKLVEVVRGPKTSSDAFAAAFNATQRAGKTAIETADRPGFCVNRFFVPWVNEACRILEEKVADIPTIEAAAKEAFGITMGPFELMNVTGVPISLHAQTTLHRELGAFYEPSAALKAQVETKANWDLTGAPDDKKVPAVAARLRGIVFAITTQLVDEGVATPRDTDLGATTGLRWKAGPFAMMNALGIAKARDEAEAVLAPWRKEFPLPTSLANRREPWHLPAVVHQFLDGGRIALVTFDRPDALNALNERVLHDLDTVLAALEKAPDLRAVVVTGAGKAFIAGADIPTMRALDARGASAYTDLGHRVLARLAALPMPVLMAINGFAFGGGLELALCGDLLYASEKAQLGLPEVGLGIHPGFGGTQRLPRRIGLGRARELTFTGRTVGADEAKAIGLVEAVFPAADLLDSVLAVARTIAQKAPLAVAGAKSSIDQGIEMDLAGGLSAEKESVALLFASKDKDEGLGAFLEKRKPVFQGR